MTVCIEKNAIRGKLITNALNIENWWNEHKYNKKSGEITETPILGEKLFELFHHKVLFKHYEITAMVGHKEYYICGKNKSWEKGETYNPEITNAFWEAFSQGLITGRKEKLSKKTTIKSRRKMAKQEKLKQYEIQALSHKVFNEVTKLKLAKSKELYSKEIQDYVKEYKKLDLEKETIKEQQEELHSKFKKKFKLGYISAASSEETLIKELAKFPQQNSIEQEIILKGIFSDKSELEEFIKELVKKFS